MVGKQAKGPGSVQRRTSSWVRSHSKTASLLALLFAFQPACSERGTSSPESLAPSLPRKVILIVVDTLRADRLACYGYSGVETPHIDALASDGVLFENAVAHVPLTLPSVSSILTGTYPVFHGIRDHSGFYLSPERTSIAELLRAEGLATGAFVSAFVLDRRFGVDQGFDYYFDRFDGVDGSREGLERRGDRTLAEALAWLEGVGDGEFFLFLHFYDPHAPYSPPEPFRSRYSSDLYDGEVAFVDSLVGDLVGFLKNRGWYSETFLVLTADHGEDLGDHGENTHGFFVYDATQHVPLIVKLPGQRAAGQQVARQVQSVDVAPTILQTLSLPPGDEMQGRGLLPPMGEQAEDSVAAIGETYYPFHHFGWSPLYFLRTERYKYIEAPRAELYDLREDPGETRNLFESRPELARRLEAELRELRDRFGSSEASARAPAPPDEQTLERLRALGYIGLSVARPEVSDYSQLPDPKDKLSVYVRLQDAVADLQDGRLPRAIDKLKGVIALDGTLPDARIQLGLAYKRAGRYGPAIEEFRQALALNPENAVAAYNLAHCYALEGRLEEAIEGFQRTLQLDPREVRAHLGLGIAYQLQGRLDPAVMEYRSALQLNPDNAQALSHLGTALLSQGHLEEAVSHLRLAVELNPADAQAHNTLGSALLLQENLPASAAHFREALRLEPGRLESLANLGLVHLKEGKLEEASRTLKRAVEIEPSFAYAHHLLGEVYAAQGRMELAEAQFRRSRALGFQGTP